MLTREFVQRLRQEGHGVQSYILRYAAEMGKIPAPTLDASHRAHWGDEHLAAARELLRQPQRRGRPRNTEG